MNSKSHSLRGSARFAVLLLSVLLLVPGTGQATYLFGADITFLSEIDPAPTFTSEALSTIEFQVPGVGGQVTFEMGPETAPPPNEDPHDYDMRVTIENYGSSASAITSLTMTLKALVDHHCWLN